MSKKIALNLTIKDFKKILSTVKKRKKKENIRDCIKIFIKIILKQIQVI